MSSKQPIAITPFSHLDLFWAGTRQECLSRGTVIIHTALDLLEKYPDYRFMVESTNFLEHFLAAYPEDGERVRQLAQSGQLEVIPMRSITYTQLPSGETLIRNLLYGREFCQHHLGMSSRIMSMSDIPGITPQMPQIAAKSGMDVLFLSHGCPPRTDHIAYRAPDGTTIRSYAPSHYATCLHLLSDGKSYDAMLEKEDAFEEHFGCVDYPIITQLGVDLFRIQEEFVSNLMRWNDDGHHPLRFSTFTEFFRDHSPANTKEISGEIPSLWPNIESSWPDIWPLDLPCEQALFNAEFFSVLCQNFSDRQQLRQAWDWLLDSMDHNQNGIGGDSSDQDKLDLKVAARLTGEQITKRLSWSLANRATAPRENAFPIVIFNPLSWQRSERVKGRTTLYSPRTARFEELKQNPQQFRLIDDKGNEIPCRLIDHRQMIADGIEVEFFAEKVPAFGARVYYLEPVERTPVSSAFTVDDGDARDRINPQGYAGLSTVETDTLRLDVDRVTGEFSLYDKTQDRYLLQNAGIVALEEKRGDYVCKMDLTGRTIPAVLEKLELIDQSPVAYSIHLTGTVYGQRFVQLLTLDANRSVLDIENRIDWQGGCYARFEQAFPFATDEEMAIDYGVPFGQVRYPETIYTDSELSFEDVVTPERGNDPDEAITKIRLVSKWIAMSDSRNTLTIGTDHRMWELEEKEIRSCMFRSIGQTSGGVIIHDDGTREGVKRPPVGEYTFRYRVALQDTDGVRDGHVGWELNAPLLPTGVGRSDVQDNPGLELPIMPDSTGTSIIICNVKPSLLEPEQTVFRCFESAGQTDSLTLPEIPGKVWFETNLMEEDAKACSETTITFKPFEIKTLLLGVQQG